MLSRTMRFLIPPLAWTLVLWCACERADNKTSERLVFQVQAENAPPNAFYYYGDNRDIYKISADGSFFISTQGEGIDGEAYIPHQLNIDLILTSGADLKSTLENRNGYRVKTQFQLGGGVIIVDHTDQAELIVTPEGDSLYAVRGEGIVSGGTDLFEKISGFFYEQSTYKITPPISEPGSPRAERHIEQINCGYELIVDFSL